MVYLFNNLERKKVSVVRYKKIIVFFKTAMIK